MRYFLTLLLTALSALGATGDIKWINIETNGWVAQASVEGYGTNGVFNFGWGTNNSPVSGSNIVLRLTSVGYNDAGAATTISRTLYGTKQLRLPYPLNAYNDVTNPAGDAIIRFALSEYVFSDCTSITATVPGNWYSNNAAATSLSMTNNSTMAHPKAIANWTWPGYQLISGNTMTLRATGFHRSGRFFRPLRLMRFIATGATSAIKVTNDVLIPTIDRSMPDAVPVNEYIGSLDISTFTQGENIRCDFQAFPWVGSSAAILDTQDNVYSQPTPLYASITNVCDRLGTYGRAYAVVDPVNGGAGLVTTNFSVASPIAPFLTINAASAAITASNNIWFGASRSNVGAGVIMLTNGNHAWTGASANVGPTPATWVSIMPYPTALRSDVVVTGTVGSKDISDRVCISNITVTATTGAGCFDTIGQLWIDKCYVNSASGVPFYRNTNHFFTHCEIPLLANGIRPFSTVNASPALVRGNTISNATGGIFPYTVIGNLISTNVNTYTFFNEIAGSTSPFAEGGIVAYNRMLNHRGTLIRAFSLFSTSNSSSGFAIVQNLVEVASTNSVAAVWVGADSTVNHLTNILIWNNTVAGQRCNLAYNDAGSAAAWRVLWSVKNNSFDDDNIKSDTFGTADGARVGNWSQVWGVGNSGNFLGNVGAVAAVAFSHTNAGGFAGLNSVESDVSFSTNYQAYVSNAASLSPSIAGAGNGNYRIQSSSPILRIRTEQLLPFDIEGRARSRFDAPGAHSSASPRRGDLNQ